MVLLVFFTPFVVVFPPVDIARLAQLVERFVYTEDVRGSSPLACTKTNRRSAVAHACLFLCTLRLFFGTLLGYFQIYI
ncbi:MAG: hypothetical protein UU98_C0003G0012 [Parcubacteria group bacterium GW2011_GWD2_42_14]|nr:MAG: hypothetical protein UU98_C0003G0012 [Parcubacteria group bacterium GW2011_GWD2_42_14]